MLPLLDDHELRPQVQDVEAGADEVLRSGGDWKDEAKGLGGVDLVLDPVGGDRFTNSIRSLRERGRVIVVGFTGGGIPEVRVNRLLLNNVSVVGAGWGAFALSKPDFLRAMGDELEGMVEAGAIRPLIGRRLPFEQAPEALGAPPAEQPLENVLQLRPEFRALELTARAADLQATTDAWKWSPSISACPAHGCG